MSMVIRKLQERVKELEIEVDSLKTQIKSLIDPLNVEQPHVEFPKEFSKCSKCGLDLSKPLGYVCANYDCPNMMHITCDASTK